MSKIQKKKISQFGKTITGKTPSSTCPEDFGSEYMFITPSDSFRNKFIDKSERYLSETGKEKLLSKLLPPKSILITCIGSAMGKVALNKFDCITNQQINSIDVNDDCDPDYLYYIFKHNYELLRNASTGSTAVPILNKTDFDNLELLVHEDFQDQQKIASVLSVLDEKIELNNRINTKLEQMAKNLYDYWFMQFNFPDANGKPYKSSGGKMVWSEELKREIPEGWSTKILKDVISRSGTGLNPRDNFKLGSGKNYYITIKNVKNGKIIFDKSCDMVDDEALQIIDRRSDLQEGDILFTSIEPVGVTYFVHKKPTNWNINESVFTIRPNYEKITSEYLYMLLSSLEMKAFTSNVSAGSVHKGVRHTVLKTFKLPYKDKKITEEFSSLIKPILKRIEVIDNENQKLAELRDWLLPMLMNRQVTVE